MQGHLLDQGIESDYGPVRRSRIQRVWYWAYLESTRTRVSYMPVQAQGIWLTARLPLEYLAKFRISRWEAQFVSRLFGWTKRTMHAQRSCEKRRMGELGAGMRKGNYLDQKCDSWIPVRPRFDSRISDLDHQAIQGQV